MELLATIGIAAKELFDYNREMYQFDQEQRLDRDLLRLEIQIKRFALFREDIRDLVELTVGKMEMYHAVGALSLWFCITWYTEGRIRATAPPFILSLYWMAIAGAFVYLLLTVWLAMHASVTSHSFGVRLLTRFVRLPIPGIQQINALNPRLVDFEQTGLNMMRVPFVQGAQDWQTRVHKPILGPGAHVDHDLKYKPIVQKGGVVQMQDLLDKGEMPLGPRKEQELRKTAKRLPGKHIELFRQLQMKWQCYDAYARVCMSLGMNQVLMSACFYLICATLLEYRAPSLCFALIVIFQSCSLAMSILDVSGVKRRKLVALWFFGSFAPCIVAAIEVTDARHSQGNHAGEPEDKYRHCVRPTTDIFCNTYYTYAFIPFVLIAGWMVGLLLLAWPSRDEKTLPRLFRTVLFVDVFALEDDTIKALTNNDGKDKPTNAADSGRCPAAEQPLTQEQAGDADEALYIAEAALRRWEAVPAGTAEANTQGEEVVRLRRQVTIHRRALNGEAARIAGTHGDMDAVALLHHGIDRRTWSELPREEQEQDPWREWLLGPFEHSTMANNYYYDLEGRQFVWSVPEGQDVLTLAEVKELVEQAEDKVCSVLGGKCLASERQDFSSSSEDDCPAAESFAGCGICKKGKGKAAFVPERLPWFVLSYMTWALVAAWLFEGGFVLCQEFGLIQVDSATNYTEEEREGDAYGKSTSDRRLQSSADVWGFALADVSWPGGLLFQPHALGCLPSGGLLIHSDEALHSAPLPMEGKPPLELAPLALSWPPAGSVALCGADPSTEGFAALPCMFGTPTAEGVAIWRPGGGNVSLSVRGRPWRRLAGATLRCAAVPGLLLEAAPADNAFCLLLVGWDGERMPVAALRLSEGPVGALPEEGSIQPAFDVPLQAEVAGLHVEPQRGRLWALRSDGGLQGWDLLHPSSLGHWQPAWTQGVTTVPGTFRGVALCEDSARGRLLVLGRHGILGPQLLWAPLPRSL